LDKVRKEDYLYSYGINSVEHLQTFYVCNIKNQIYQRGERNFKHETKNHITYTGNNFVIANIQQLWQGKFTCLPANTSVSGINIWGASIFPNDDGGR